MNASHTEGGAAIKYQSKTGATALIIGILGTSFASLFYKLSFATGLDPLWVNALRLGVTLVLMAPFTILNRQNRQNLRHVSRSGFWISALAGTLLAVHFTTWALALENTDVFAASAIWGTYLLMTAAFSSLFLHEKTSRSALMGLVIATVGVVVCNLGGSTGKLSGNLLALVAAFLQALYTLCGRKARAELDVQTYTSIVYGFTFAWMMVFVWLFHAPVTGFQPQNLLWALGLAVFATLLGHTMLNLALKYFKAPTVSAAMLTTVITAPLIVFLVLGDVPSRNTFIGGCIIIVGLLLYLWMERRDGRAAKAAQPVDAGQ
ncbi:MAG: DMT family transporter [Eubacteriales bacterium]|nr:DMT family transporter [Eubacteriales bacterium]